MDRSDRDVITRTHISPLSQVCLFQELVQLNRHIGVLGPRNCGRTLDSHCRYHSIYAFYVPIKSIVIRCSIIRRPTTTRNVVSRWISHKNACVCLYADGESRDVTRKKASRKKKKKKYIKPVVRNVLRVQST